MKGKGVRWERKGSRWRGMEKGVRSSTSSIKRGFVCWLTDITMVIWIWINSDQLRSTSFVYI